MGHLHEPRFNILHAWYQQLFVSSCTQRLGELSKVSAPTYNHLSSSLDRIHPTSQLPRWNFNKADWERFHAATRNMCDNLASPEFDINSCYAAFQKKLLKIAKDTIPRGFWKNCIPKWDARCNELASHHKKVQSMEKKLLSANHLNDHLLTLNGKNNGYLLLKVSIWNGPVGECGQQSTNLLVARMSPRIQIQSTPTHSRHVC